MIQFLLKKKNLRAMITLKTLKENVNLMPTNPGIYLFTNLVNNKKYVGQAKSLRTRLRSHLQTANKSGNPRMILYKSILNSNRNVRKFRYL